MKIGIVGASGYGNVGDDTYPIVFESHVPEHHLCFYNSDLPERLPDDLDMLVVGGGGLIYTSNSRSLQGHFKYMTHYLDWAIAQQIPWGFISCGIQVRRDANGDFQFDSLRPWVPYIIKAHFVTLRSQKGVEILRDMSGRTDIQWYPDLAYLYRPSVCVSKNRSVVLICAGGISVKNSSIRQMIEPFLTTGNRLVIMGMGSPQDDKGHLELAREYFPASEIVANPSSELAMEIISKASFVVTGRYHGIIFSRCAGVPFWRTMKGPFKVVHEDIFSNMDDAEQHIRVLQEQISKCSERSVSSRSKAEIACPKNSIANT